MRIAIIGGYGNAGRLIAEMLAGDLSFELLLLGRDAARAEREAKRLQGGGGARVQGAVVDARSPDSLAGALSGVDLVVVASSTSESASVVAEAALQSGADYFDVQLSSPQKLASLRSLEPRIRSDGRCFVTDGGVHPGLPAALVRWARDELGAVGEAHVGMAFVTDWAGLHFSDSTLREFVAEFRNFDPSVYRRGEWLRGMRHSRQFDFGPAVGKKRCTPMCLEEVRLLVREMGPDVTIGCYIAGFGTVVDMIYLPLTMALMSLFPRRPEVAGRLFYSGLRRFASGSNAVALRLDVSLADAERPTLVVRIADSDGYRLTAASAVACLRQMVAEDRRVGLWTQGMFVRPRPFLDDLRRLGVDIRIARL